jgi:hypothetical protein
VLIQRARSKLDELRALIEQGHLKPIVDTVLPLHEVAQAHQRLEQGGVRGKIVLQVVPSSWFFFQDMADLSMAKPFCKNNAGSAH